MTCVPAAHGVRVHYRREARLRRREREPLRDRDLPREPPIARRDLLADARRRAPLRFPPFRPILEKNSGPRALRVASPPLRPAPWRDPALLRASRLEPLVFLAMCFDLPGATERPLPREPCSRRGARASEGAPAGEPRGETGRKRAPRDPRPARDRRRGSPAEVARPSRPRTRAGRPRIGSSARRAGDGPRSAGAKPASTPRPGRGPPAAGTRGAPGRSPPAGRRMPCRGVLRWRPPPPRRGGGRRCPSPAGRRRAGAACASRPRSRRRAGRARG